jgi:methyl-accepting chemotaxis protein
MRVGSKLTISYLAVASISAVIGAIGIRNMATMNGLADEMYRKELLGVLYAQDANLNLIYVARAENNLILAETQDQRTRYFGDYQNYLKQLDDDLAKAKPLVTTDKGTLTLNRVHDAEEEWKKVSRQVVDTAMSAAPGTAEETGAPPAAATAGAAAGAAKGAGMSAAMKATADAARLSLGDARVKLDVMDYLIKDLVGQQRSDAEAEAARTAAIFRQSLVIMLAFVIGGVLLSIFLGLVVSRMISVPLRKSLEFSEAIAAGDLTQKIDLNRRDEIGMLMKSFNVMSAKLRGIVGAVQTNAEQVAASSKEISTSAQRLSEGAQSQASTLEETAASVEELTSSVDQVSENAQSQVSGVERGTALMNQVEKAIEEVSANLTSIASLTGQSVEKATSGARAVEQVVDGINRIAASSEKIGGIVDVISDIADQTNLLSLNAAIEAARAGEHGRGFAVVADEVSKLAERSASSTREIAGLIRESVKNVTEGVRTAQGSQKAMEEIREGAQKAQEVTGGLVESMKKQVVAIQQLASALSGINEMSSSISAAAEEQTTNAKQVSKAVENVNELTQTAASAAAQMSAATEQLSSMAQELQRMMEQFKVGDADRALPGGDHAALESDDQESGQQGPGEQRSLPA